ncbi:MAG: hypothetical protein GYB65_02815 [Chloroflexi bacterium]|nr:hypothetical protein [Chloroflexota bacterium]
MVKSYLWRRWALIVVTLLLAGLLLVACGGDDGDGDSSNGDGAGDTQRDEGATSDDSEAVPGGQPSIWEQVTAIPNQTATLDALVGEALTATASAAPALPDDADLTATAARWTATPDYAALGQAQLDAAQTATATQRALEAGAVESADLAATSDAFAADFIAAYNAELTLTATQQIATPDAQQVVRQTVKAEYDTALTATATRWTATPTRPTATQAPTGTRDPSLPTAVPPWTPTITFTPSRTYTPSPETPTLTPTATFTETATPTFTYTPSLTYTPSPTQPGPSVDVDSSEMNAALANDPSIAAQVGNTLAVLPTVRFDQNLMIVEFSILATPSVASSARPVVIELDVGLDQGRLVVTERRSVFVDDIGGIYQTEIKDYISAMAATRLSELVLSNLPEYVGILDLIFLPPDQIVVQSVVLTPPAQTPTPVPPEVVSPTPVTPTATPITPEASGNTGDDTTPDVSPEPDNEAQG